MRRETGKRRRWGERERKGGGREEEGERRRRGGELTVFRSNLPLEPLYPACSRRSRRWGVRGGEGHHKAVL